jgi:hypothetical protein
VVPGRRPVAGGWASLPDDWPRDPGRPPPERRGPRPDRRRHRRPPAHAGRGPPPARRAGLELGGGS